MSRYSISELARLAGVSVRTLHHYDHIGLLQPAGRSAGGYRLYHAEQLYRLQQILLLKELDFRLPQIQQMLSDPQFDLRQSLRQQQQAIQARHAELGALLKSLSHTLAYLEQSQMTDPQSLFHGFSSKALHNEALQRWGDEVQQSQQQWQQLTPTQQQTRQVEGETIAKHLATLRHLPPDAPEVQQLAKAQHAWLLQFGSCPVSRLALLGAMYIEDPRFRAYYDRFGEGTAQLLGDALQIYADALAASADDRTC